MKQLISNEWIFIGLIATIFIVALFIHVKAGVAMSNITNIKDLYVTTFINIIVFILSLLFMLGGLWQITLIHLIISITSIIYEDIKKKK